MKSKVTDTKYGVVTSNKFDKQLRKIIKQGKNIEKLSNVVKKLANGETLDDRNEKMGYKIREAQMNKIPYMLVVGPKEKDDNVVAVRSRFAGDEGTKNIDEFIKDIRNEIDNLTIREVTKKEE